MPLRIVVNKGTAPTPQYVEPNTIVNRALRQGNPNAGRAGGITIPYITTDQTGLRYKIQRGSKGEEIKFDTGTLLLRLRQEMFIANTLSECKRRILISHENGHVTDNQEIMNKMETAIRANRILKDILIEPKWIPRIQFNATQTTIQSTVASIFRSLTDQASAARDTQAEYKRINDEMKKCP
jgi:hypothetical protein